MTDLLREEQYQRNQKARENWARYATHRGHITRMLCEACPPDGGRLCLVGAGNCNDVDLARLVDRYRQIHLVDLDLDAMKWGIDQQRLTGRPEIAVHGGVDVSGIAEQCESWVKHAPNWNELQHGLEIASHGPPLPGGQPFDVVASLCLISQLIEMVSKGVGESHPELLRFVTAVRLSHMRQLVDGVRPGGRIILVIEVVSSLTYPLLANVPENELSHVVKRLINERNFFTGLNPFVVQQLFKDSQELSSLVIEAHLTRPWLWDFGPRVYACCAVIAKRSSLAV